MGDGVAGQRKPRGEAMVIGVGEWHVAHIVVRGSKKLLIAVSSRRLAYHA